MGALRARWCGLMGGVVMAIWMGGCATTRAPAPPSMPAESWEVESIAAIRRTLRSSCRKLRSVNAGAPQKASLLDKAREEAKSALEGWSCAIEYWGDDVPSAYVGHPDWRGATAEVTAGVTEMLKRTEAGNVQMAFKACGRTCGLFVKLNEDAGVHRTSDILFHFRKTAKPLAEHIQPRNVGPLRDAAGRLRKIRDQALTEPMGGTGSPADQRGALDRFSRAVDAFLKAAADDAAADLPARHGETMKAMEEAYDLFL